MSFLFNGLTASVTISGGISTDTSQVPTGATKIHFCWYKLTGAASASFDVYTPAVGKSLYITEIIYVYSANAASVVKIGDNATTAYVDNTRYDNMIYAMGTSSNRGMVLHFDKPLVIATKLVLSQISATAEYQHLTVSGWEI